MIEDRTRYNFRYDPLIDWVMRFGPLDDSEDRVLWVGIGHWNADINGMHTFVHPVDSTKTNILLDFESRNNHAAWEDKFDRILTYDIETAEWRNKVLGEEKYIAVYPPIGDEIISRLPNKPQKKLDVIACGAITGMFLFENIFMPIKKFHHAWVGSGGEVPKEKLPMILELNNVLKYGTYIEKLEKISTSRVTICWNACTLSAKFREQLRESSIMQQDPKYRHALIDDPTNTNEYLQWPQLKTRAFEAAACKSLILCCYDDFRYLEKWFEEGKEFVYFKPGELEETLTNILNNFNDYEEIIENAYNKVSSCYKISNFWQDFIESIDK